MTNPDTRPAVPPIEGHYALLRNGMIAGPLSGPKDGKLHPYASQAGDYYISIHHSPLRWFAENGNCGWHDLALDIIATISPADMQAVANGEMQALQSRVLELEAREKIAIEGLGQIVEGLNPNWRGQATGTQKTQNLARGILEKLT